MLDNFQFSSLNSCVSVATKFKNNSDPEAFSAIVSEDEPQMKVSSICYFVLQQFQLFLDAVSFIYLLQQNKADNFTTHSKAETLTYFDISEQAIIHYHATEDCNL